MNKLKRKAIYLFIYLCCCLAAYALLAHIVPPPEPKVKVSAFLRVKNEIKTVISTLDSIDGLFYRIVIIHSNEKDDGSVAAMHEWCDKRKYCEIYEYPHAVLPAGHKDYLTGKWKRENSLAAYYDFGLEKFSPEEYVVKIDGDQIYIKPRLKAFIDTIKRNDAITDKIRYGFRGYNTFSWHNRLVFLKGHTVNGGEDHFVLKRKYIKPFAQMARYELMQCADGLRLKMMSDLYWFHYMKQLRGYKTEDKEKVSQEETQPLNEKELELYKKYILPLLKKNNSPYQNLKL